MYIITWSEKTYVTQPEAQEHKALTCNLHAAAALFNSLTKDIRTIEARIRDDAGNLVSGGFYTQA